MFSTNTKERQTIYRNWGYQDGMLMAELGKPYMFAHFNKYYLAGWQDGYSDWKRARN